MSGFVTRFYRWLFRRQPPQPEPEVTTREELLETLAREFSNGHGIVTNMASRIPSQRTVRRRARQARRATP